MLHRSIVEAAAEAVGAEVQIIGPTLRGESGSTFDVRVGRDEAILKLLANGPGVVENQKRLIRLVGRLRRRGSPVPHYLGSGHTDAVAFTLQRRLPGEMLEPRPGQRLVTACGRVRVRSAGNDGRRCTSPISSFAKSSGP